MARSVVFRLVVDRRGMAGEAGCGMLRTGRLRSGMAGKARCGAVRQCLDRFGVAGKVWRGVAS